MGVFELKISGDQLVSVQQVVEVLQQVAGMLADRASTEIGTDGGNIRINGQQVGTWLLAQLPDVKLTLRDAVKRIPFAFPPYPPQPIPRRVIPPNEEPCTDCPNPSCFNYELCSKKATR